MLRMESFVRKVAPIVLRRADAPEILAFRHPRAGAQLVKGTWEEGESGEEAALRELAEESGIGNAAVVKPLGQLPFRRIRQHWHFYLCRVPSQLPNSWTFYTQDGGGHLFDFFWHDLNEPPGRGWHEDFRRAVSFVRRRLREEDPPLNTISYDHKEDNR